MKKTLFVPSGHCAKKKKQVLGLGLSLTYVHLLWGWFPYMLSDVCKKGWGMLSELAIVETAKTKGMVTVGLK